MIFYRYEIAYGTVDNLVLREFTLAKETPGGYWISLGLHSISKDKWISKSSKKRYAYPTKEEALINYIKRTEKRLRILESQIKLCKTGLSQANELS